MIVATKSGSGFASLFLVAFAMLVIACEGAGPGSGCEADGDCRSGLECVPNRAGGAQCMARCSTDTWLCSDGAVCFEIPVEGFVCWFGGATSFRAACGELLECEPGTICEGGVCLQACVLGAETDAGVNPVCAPLETCGASSANPLGGVCSRSME